jgi:hypothetical protein
MFLIREYMWRKYETHFLTVNFIDFFISQWSSPFDKGVFKRQIKIHILRVPSPRPSRPRGLFYFKYLYPGQSALSYWGKGRAKYGSSLNICSRLLLLRGKNTNEKFKKAMFAFIWKLKGWSIIKTICSKLFYCQDLYLYFFL